VQYRGISDWHVAHYRQSVESRHEFDDDEVETMLIILSPPRYYLFVKNDKPTNVAFRATTISPEIFGDDFTMEELEEYSSRDPIVYDKASAMSKRQRKVFESDVRSLEEQDNVVKDCLQEKPYPAQKKLMIIAENDISKQFTSDPRFCDSVVMNPTGVASLKWRKRLEETFMEEKPSLVISYLGEVDHQFDDIAEYFFLLDDFAAAGCGILHFDRQFTDRWNPRFRTPVYHCRGNASFATNVEGIAPIVQK
jgi:hypothetical protein